ncbi:galactose mutarotase-like enzyme [Novosphingobium chloroacetimidivorans]|uniref:Galactose mutarotase-like enzyme n=1 Tax=Novosphingobium chloroacetimidivorans TaxID=1428314 RepID=A0A7W7KCQ0_9SPHN|nr:aldose 1-epimerase family protein [Novosphingobium chloroacetimidivorans]MBB4860026.1 galactose mutarotase-like enzyme [Novosphingobium chloroacetimidivorans]
MSELVSIASDKLTARINPLGAELWSLADADGREYMTDADPAFWTGHAPILFPIVGMVRDGRYRLGDASYAIPKHGVARHSHFDVVAAEADSAHFRLGDTPETRASYPFAFMLDVLFRLSGATLQVESRVTNLGDQPMPFSFGYHPAFAWPLPGGAAKEDHRVVFAEPEPGPVRRIDPVSGLLLEQSFSSPVEGDTLVPTAALFEADALIWDQLASRSVRFGAPGGASLQITFPDMPMLGIWQKPGANYLCIEPWQGIADPIGYDGDFRDKPGVLTLAPDEARSFRMGVTVTQETA